MYGLVNRAIEGLVRRQHGDEAWGRVCGRAGLSTRGFVAMESYPDAMTLAQVGAVSEELHVSPERVLEAFGEFWMTFTAEEGYGELLGLMGSTFGEFMDNLDAMHARIAATMPHLVPPSFTREVTPEGDTILHYESARKGLAPMVIGLLKGLGVRFHRRIDVTQLDDAPDGHARFLVRDGP